MVFPLHEPPQPFQSKLNMPPRCAACPANMYADHALRLAQEIVTENFFLCLLRQTGKGGGKFRMAAIILAEVGDFTRFDSPDKLLAYAGMSPSTYQSGQLKNCYPHMEKRGSRYLRYALYNATKYVCHWNPTFAAYLAKKRAEGKHYNVALSHAAKKLVRLIFAMEKSRQPYCSAA